MSNTPQDGGMAFPQGVDQGASAAGFPIVEHRGGMTLRDWFAGQALVGHVQIPVARGGRMSADATAYDAYLYADAMLAERAKARTP